MTKYSIKDLERYSGVKAHTIRIWEQRYQLLVPKRTETNIRFYDEDQLKYLLNVTLLLDNGYKISQVCKFSEEEFIDQLRSVIDANVNSKKDQQINSSVNELVISMLDLDERRFDKILSASLLSHSFEEVLQEVIYPFLKRIGVMWRTGEVSTAQEHFIYQLIRQKIIVAIDGLAMPPRSAEKFLLFLPQSEFHDLLILLFTYILKNRGKQCIYLGMDIPFKDLKQVTAITKPNTLFTFIKAPASKLDTQAYVYELSETFSDKSILITGNPYFMEELEYPDNVLLIPEVEDLMPILEE